MKKIVSMFSDVRNVTYIKPSPDGEKVLFGVSGADLASDRSREWIWLYDIRSGAFRQLTFSGEQKKGGWLDDETIFFVEHRPGKTAFFSLSLNCRSAEPMFEVDISGAEAECIGRDKFVILGRRRDSDPGDGQNELYSVYDEYPWHIDGMGYSNKIRSGIWIWENGELKEVTGRLFQTNQVANSRMGLILSEDKKRIYFFGQKVERFTKPAPDFYVYDIEKQETSLLFKNGRYGFSGGFEYKGRVYLVANISLIGEKQDFSASDIISAAPGDGRWRLELAPDQTVGGLWRGKDGLILVLNEHDKSNIYSWTPGGEPELLCSPEHFVRGAVCPCADGLYYVGSAPMKVRELVRLKDGKDESVTDLTSEELKGYEISPNEPIAVQSDEGHVIYGWVVRPHGYLPGKKYPGLLMIHGGPQSAYLDVLDVSMQRYAAAGYFVFFCNPRGSTNYGREYMDLRLKYGTVDFKDIMDFTDGVLRAYPDIDPDRLGATGGSYGGFMCNWIVGHTDRFKAVISQRSISNWFTKYCCTDISYAAKWGQGGTPWDEPELIWEHSPLKYANNFKTPTLLLQNENDNRCPVDQAEQMLTALIERGVPCRMVLFHNASHGVMSPAQTVKKDEEVIGWLDKYVK